MSSPFGHSIAGYIVDAFEPKTLKVHSVKRLFLYVFMANIPDLDFIPGFLMGRPNLLHHGISHSLGAAVLFSILAAKSAFTDSALFIIELLFESISTTFLY